MGEAMTNKTITPACCTCGKPTACGKMICEECCYEPLPVPPAGGEPEALIDQLDDYIARINGDDRGSNATVNELRGHVTRLQAEVERLKADFESLAVKLSDALKQRDERRAMVIEVSRKCARSDIRAGELQSELTKALELLRDINDAPGGSSFRKHIEALLSNQSAPADKGQGEPVGLQHMAVAEDGKLRGIPGRKMQNCELYALPDGSAIRFPLYAEQPVPVAVVMPERKTWDGLRATARNLKGEAWNACLDEVARLNSEPKP